MRSNADLWAGNYALTHRGFPYPSLLSRMSKLCIEVSDDTEQSDSVLILAACRDGDRIFKLWVSACCVERRSGQRYLLAEYVGSTDALPARLDEEKFGEWHETKIEDALEWVWEGDHAGDLVVALARIIGVSTPSITGGKRCPRQRDNDEYSFTKFGFKYPSSIKALGVVHDATNDADEQDTLVLVTPSADVFRIRVQSSCVEQRSDPASPRFRLDLYQGGAPLDVEDLDDDWCAMWFGDDATELTNELADIIQEQ